MTHITVLWEYLTARLDAARQQGGGLSIEWALIIAAVAALAITVTAILAGKVTGIAEGIPTE